MILKSEIKYFQFLLGMILSLVLVFAAFAITNTKDFFRIEFFDRFAWSIFVGLGTYFLVFAIWINRYKESRDRLHFMLTINKMKVSLTRWFFGISPFIITWIMLELLRFFVPVDFLLYIDGVIAQLGLLFIFIVTFDIMLNYTNGFVKTKFWLTVLVTGIIVTLSVFIIYLVTYSFIPPFIIGGSEFYFMAWGFLISIFDIYVFYNRETFIR